MIRKRVFLTHNLELVVADFYLFFVLIRKSRLNIIGDRPNAVVPWYVYVKGAVHTVWVFICMFLELFLFAKKNEILDIRAGFIVFPGLPLALLFYARALIGRTDGA